MWQQTCLFYPLSSVSLKFVLIWLQVRYDDDDDDDGTAADPLLEGGMPLPIRLAAEFPDELVATPIEDIDPYYSNKKVLSGYFVKLGRWWFLCHSWQLYKLATSFLGGGGRGAAELLAKFSMRLRPNYHTKLSLLKYTQCVHCRFSICLHRKIYDGKLIYNSFW